MQNVYYKYFLFTILLSSSLLSYNVSGFVKDSSNGEPVPFSNTFISKLGSDKIVKGASSDINGYFIITGLEAGDYILTISTIGYEIFKKEIIINDADNQENIRLDVLLLPQAIDLNEVSVSSERTRFNEKVEVSRVNITSEEIKMIPAFVESDVFRALQNLPSVSSANDFNAALIVRGGSPDENLVLLDGTQIYNPYHVGGIFSTFNADLISDTEFLAGGFPAEYGNRLSSVLSITSKEGNSKEGRLPDGWGIKKYWDYNDINLDVSLLSSKVSAQGPLYKGSWIFSGRRTYFDQFVKAYYNSRDETSPFDYYFWDTHFKIQTSPIKYHKFIYSQFNGSDNLFVNITAEDFPQVNFDWDWINSTNSFEWKYYPNSNYFVETMISRTKYQFDVGFEVDFTTIDQETIEECEESLGEDVEVGYAPDLTYILINSVKDYTLNQNYKLFISDYYDIELGWEYKTLNMAYSEEFAGTQTASKTDTPNISSAFIKNLWKPISNLSLDIGMRLSKSSYYDNYILDPRIGLKYNIIPDLALKMMWGKFTQFMFTINQEEQLLRLVDFWQAVGESKAPQSNEHYVIGAEYWISNGNTVSIEVYYKPYSTVYDLSLVADPIDEDSYFSSGIGTAKGIELLYQFNTNRLNGWLGYSFSDITREVDLNQNGEVSDSEKYKSNYNKPHALNFVLNYKLSPKKKWDFGLTGTLTSGAPYTPVIGKVFSQSVEQYGSLENPYLYLTNLYGNRNSAQYPMYFRTDISLTKGGKLFNNPAQWKFQIINLTNNFNVLFYNWNHYSSPSKVSAVSMFPLIFTFGVSLEL